MCLAMSSANAGPVELANATSTGRPRELPAVPGARSCGHAVPWVKNRLRAASTAGYWHPFLSHLGRLAIDRPELMTPHVTAAAAVLGVKSQAQAGQWVIAAHTELPDR
jgi:hypothetical protein